MAIRAADILGEAPEAGRQEGIRAGDGLEAIRDIPLAGFEAGRQEGIRAGDGPGRGIRGEGLGKFRAEDNLGEAFRRQERFEAGLTVDHPDLPGTLQKKASSTSIEAFRRVGPRGAGSDRPWSSWWSPII